MTKDRVCANREDAPTLLEIHISAVMLSGLVQAMDEMSELLGPKALPISACIMAAVPLANDICHEIQEMM